jgi:hypothetical protein
MSTKINKALSTLPKGVIATSCWLREQGIRFDLLDRYRKSGWLESMGHGAAKRNGVNITWLGAVYALQKQLGLSIHPGGKTALTLRGQGHFIPMGRMRAMVFLQREEHLPKWFTNKTWDANVVLVPTNLFPVSCAAGLSEWQAGDFSVNVSSAERAILEMLYCIPKRETLSEARYIIEGLTTLRPPIVQELLEQCSSVKAKRLLLAMAEDFDLPWLKKVQTSRVDLGKGPRVVAPGGYLHSKYQITLPRDWLDNRDEP